MNKQKEIINYLQRKYTIEELKFLKSELVYEYVDNEDAEKYDDDYEKAYDNMGTGEAIETDIVEKMTRDVKKNLILMYGPKK